MEDLTFGEQVKIILGRKGMTIKELAETIEAKTGKKMSRQNLTQRLGRDNFQEQDMRMIARILECPFQLSIMGAEPERRETGAAYEEEAQAAYEQESAAGQTEVQAAETVREDTVPDTVEMQAEEAQAETLEAEMLTTEAESTEEETQMTEAEAAEEEMQTAAAETAEEEMQTAAAETAEAEMQMTAAETAEAEEQPAEEPEAVRGETEPEVSTEPEMEPEAYGGEQSEAAEESWYSGSDVGPDERDMTIGELYDIHEELTQLEENAKAGESVEAIKEELEKPKRDWFRGNFFLRRKKKDEKKEVKEPVHETVQQAAPEPEPQEFYEEEARQEEPEAYREEERGFEPVISYQDAEEDREAGDVNPYTGKEYQSNSVRMHPTRIGYVQVYDRSIHKWTDMTEWAFLGYQERKKALLGSAYEPPIYLD